VLTLVKVFVGWVPTAVTVAMMTTEMSAAIRPYSRAVAPASSLKERREDITGSCELRSQRFHFGDPSLLVIFDRIMHEPD